MQIVPERRSDPEFSRHEIGPKRACNVRQAATEACTPLQVEPRSAPCSPGSVQMSRKRREEKERIERKRTANSQYDRKNESETYAMTFEQRLDPNGQKQKKMLALDGGGIRGVIALEVLKRIEKILREREQNPNLVLSDYFDYFAGTSTGAIIATCLSI